jgi:hypothetical protein
MILCDTERVAKRCCTGDIIWIALPLSTTDVKVAETMEEKLALRPDLKPMVEWCMDWIWLERAAGRKAGRTIIQSAWDRARTENPADELLNNAYWTTRPTKGS